MEILLVESDRQVRDQVKVGLQQFPEFNVTVGEGYAALNELRQSRFDCVFIGIDPNGTEGLSLLDHMRSFDRSTDLVVMASHGQKGNYRFGSVTDKVMRNSPVPVTTIPIDPQK